MPLRRLAPRTPRQDLGSWRAQLQRDSRRRMRSSLGGASGKCVALLVASKKRRERGGAAPAGEDCLLNVTSRRALNRRCFDEAPTDEFSHVTCDLDVSSLGAAPRRPLCPRRARAPKRMRGIAIGARTGGAPQLFPRAFRRHCRGMASRAARGHVVPARYCAQNTQCVAMAHRLAPR